MFKRILVVILSLFLFCPKSFAKMDFGIDVLKKENFKTLEGAHVALITNQTGVDKYGASTVDILYKAPNVKLVCLFSAEHGPRGTVGHGQSVESSTDPITGIPIYSLYGKDQRPTDSMLQGVDTIVFDIQDIGTRFYTFISTMGLALEEAAKRKLRFVLLDRPNPIRGDIVEGDLLDKDIKRLTGYFSIPVRYGLTVGELARWMNDTQKLDANLVVVPLRKWNRDHWFDQTGHDFVPPSPNIRNLTEALLYSGIGCFEATNISVGRGTETPFEILGAPWVDGKALCAFLREKNLAGAAFEPVEFTPEDDLFKGEVCHGVKVIVTNRNLLRPFDIFIAAFLFLHSNNPEFKPNWEEVRVVTGSNKLKEAAEKGQTWDELRIFYQTALQDFRSGIKSYYLYE